MGPDKSKAHHERSGETQKAHTGRSETAEKGRKGFNNEPPGGGTRGVSEKGGHQTGFVTGNGAERGSSQLHKRLGRHRSRLTENGSGALRWKRENNSD